MLNGRNNTLTTLVLDLGLDQGALSARVWAEAPACCWPPPWPLSTAHKPPPLFPFVSSVFPVGRECLSPEGEYSQNRVEAVSERQSPGQPRCRSSGRAGAGGMLCLNPTSTRVSRRAARASRSSSRGSPRRRCPLPRPALPLVRC